MKDSSELYLTKDLGESAALLTGGCAIRDIQWKNSEAYFVFGERKACQQMSQKYFFGGLELPVRFFYENLRLIKRKLYSDQRARGVNNNVF